MRWISKIISWPLDFALPQRCAGCGVVQPGPGDFCGPCWQALSHMPPSGCVRCGLPMEQSGLICGPCLANPPSHDGVHAAVDYGDIARRVVLRLKYGRKLGLAPVMARLMLRHAATVPEAILVPVPLHWTRLWHRGFNQSLVIARSIARQTGQQVHPNLLVRVRRTQSLGGLGRAARAREVWGVFALNTRLDLPDVRGREVLLVDDVYTTGATANACARLLKRKGARSVHILCWARVLQDRFEH